MRVRYGGKTYKIKKAKDKGQVLALVEYFEAVFSDVSGIQTAADLRNHVAKFTDQNMKLLVAMVEDDPTFRGMGSIGFLKFLDAIIKVNRLKKLWIRSIKMMTAKDRRRKSWRLDKLHSKR